jgi:hypothetical protein
MLLSLPFLLILAVSVIVAIIVSATAVVVVSRGQPRDGLYCGKCAYSAQGLPDDRCPECGGDFKIIGLTDRPHGRNWRAALLVLVWGIVSPFALFPVAIFVLANAPKYVLEQNFEIWHQPASGAYDRVHIEHNSTSRTRWVNPVPTEARSTWLARFERRPFALDVQGDMLTGLVEVSEGGTERTLRADLSVGLIADLLAGAFPDSDTDLLALEAKEVHDRLSYQIDPTLSDPVPASLGRIGNNSRSNWRTPVRAYTLPVLGFFLLVWIAGIVLIGRWSLRRQVG